MKRTNKMAGDTGNARKAVIAPTAWEREKNPIEAFMSRTDAEKEAVYKSVDRAFSPEELQPLTSTQRKVWAKARKRMGRPRIGKGARVISLSVEKGLLQRADAYAKRLGLTRAQLVARGLEAVIE